MIAMAKRIRVSIAVFAALIGNAAAAAPSKPVSLKEAADYALAESGAKREPAWSASDESISLRAKSIATAVISDPAIKDREGDSVFKAACGLKDDPIGARSLNMLTAASVARMRMNPRNLPSSTEARVTTMVAMNRIESYADGYAAGAKAVAGLLFSISPEAKAKFCGMVRNQAAQ